MKKLLVLSILLGMFIFIGNAFAYDYYGSSKRGYNSERSNPYSYGGYNSGNRNYQHGGELRYQEGYYRKNGTYVQPHYKTGPDQYKQNNRKNLYGY